MIRRTALCLALAALPLGIGACENVVPKTALGYTADAKRAYEAAMQEFDAHNWIEAQNAMREVKRKYSYSKYARLAELRIADADFQQDKFADAIREYRQFVHDHRSDAEDVTYARSKIAEAEYAQISDSIVLAAGEERDQAVVYDAYKELRGYLHDYPDAKESKKMRELLADVTSRLVRHELYVARFYLGKNNYDAAVLRIQYALRNFAPGLEGAPGDYGPSGLEPEALLLLGETYLKMRKYPDARSQFQTILGRFQDSGLTVPAKNYLEWMRQRGV
ncbi:MAG TPA: outer membrane protein assembly factor BamD [Polyangiaceae bacterium]|jgi:outer membrane protein assembly factor BamD